MSKKSPKHLKDDFNEVYNFIREKISIPDEHTKIFAEHAKSLHSLTYPLILWRFRLDELPAHAQVFIDELASDALQILPQILMGYSKTAKLLVRGIIENTLRHIYFADHPVEFARMNRDAKWYVSMDGLFEYTRNHHEFIRSEKRFDAISQLSSMYSQLSAGVHGRSVKDLEMRLALENIKYDKLLATTDISNLKKCSQAVNFLLAIFHHHRVHRFGMEDQKLIFGSMPPEARQAWSDHEK